MRKPVRSTAIMFWAAVLFAGGVTTASAARPDSAPAGQPASGPVLVDCFWRSNVRPNDFVLACGDGNSRLAGLHWSQWGPAGATAQGVNVVNDCKPYCAAGTFRSYPVTVRLDRPDTWKKDPGLTHFTRMSLTYSGGAPEGYSQVMTYPLWN
ncbi:hypothetical protein [Streptomyces sp. V3I7]|uniref:hypothetical protein n=1 Tax=Streptomyces sp. V3I7 TaxID=3042278 RepID=UPI0027801746|nr:hypothetical protein [Streptomyces sp. V3I7]MDQ0994575.1 hypothetical protein [Streptomyces sp. V3I7]